MRVRARKKHLVTGKKCGSTFTVGLSLIFVQTLWAPKCLLFFISKNVKNFIWHYRFEKLKFYYAEHFVFVISKKALNAHRMGEIWTFKNQKTIIVKWSECIDFNVNGSGWCHINIYIHAHASTLPSSSAHTVHGCCSRVNSN